MQHANVFARHDVDQFTGLNMSDLDEIGLESKDIGIRKRECVGVTLPRNPPVRPSAPTIVVDEE